MAKVSAKCCAHKIREAIYGILFAILIANYLSFRVKAQPVHDTPSVEMIAATNEPRNGGQGLDDREIYQYLYTFPEGLPNGGIFHVHLEDYPKDQYGGWDAIATLRGGVLELSYWSASNRIGMGQILLESDVDSPGLYVGYQTGIDQSIKNSPRWVRSPIVIGPPTLLNSIVSHPWLRGHTSILLDIPIN